MQSAFTSLPCPCDSSELWLWKQHQCLSGLRIACFAPGDHEHIIWLPKRHKEMESGKGSRLRSGGEDAGSAHTPLSSSHTPKAQEVIWIETHVLSGDFRQLLAED